MKHTREELQLATGAKLDEIGVDLELPRVVEWRGGHPEPDMAYRSILLAKYALVEAQERIDARNSVRDAVHANR